MKRKIVSKLLAGCLIVTLTTPAQTFAVTSEEQNQQLETMENGEEPEDDKESEEGEEPEEEKEQKTFPLSDEGMDEAIAWLFERFETEKSKWFNASRYAMHIVNNQTF